MGGGIADGAGSRHGPLRRHPDWIRARMPSGENYHDLKGLLRGLDLNTVCEEAHCPNIGECWDQRTATIMILGDTCTRACGFCAVKTGRPTWFDDDEPRRVAEAVGAMRPRARRRDERRPRRPARRRRADLRRDDPRDARDDARAWASRSSSRTSTARTTRLRTVMDARPDILNHNLETVKRLQKPVRKRARWDRSLYVLRRAKEMADEIGYAVHTKSSLMVGLGETRDGADRGVRGAARGRRRHPHDRPVPAAVRRSTCRSSATTTPTSSPR